MDIRTYIKSQLLPPLKIYSTPVQEALLEIITWRLEELYNLTVKFPEIISPSSDRFDILQAIIEQFQFSMNNEAKLEEQISILDSVLHSYVQRGSIESIENMWKYYGGDLPKNVKVHIPSSSLFRYSVSSWSGNHVFQDDNVNRPGAYEIELINNHYPIDKLKEFMLKELVAAGTRIYFKNTISSIMTSDEFSDSSSHFIYEPIRKKFFVEIQEYVSNTIQGLIFSGYSPLSTNSHSRATWSGTPTILLEYTLIFNSLVKNTEESYDAFYYDVYDLLFSYSKYIKTIRFYYNMRRDTLISRTSYTYCTTTTNRYPITRNLYDKDGNLIVKTSNYPGYFVLMQSALGEEVI